MAISASGGVVDFGLPVRPADNGHLGLGADDRAALLVDQCGLGADSKGAVGA